MHLPPSRLGRLEKRLREMGATSVARSKRGRVRSILALMFGHFAIWRTSVYSFLVREESLASL
jgi:hypothetical protein